MSDNQDDIKALQDIKSALEAEKDTVDEQVKKMDEEFDANPDVQEMGKIADELEDLDTEAKQEEDKGAAGVVQDQIDAM